MVETHSDPKHASKSLRARCRRDKKEVIHIEGPPFCAGYFSASPFQNSITSIV